MDKWWEKYQESIQDSNNDKMSEISENSHFLRVDAFEQEEQSWFFIGAFGDQIIK